MLRVYWAAPYLGAPALALANDRDLLAATADRSRS
jgi:hypothetical protein